MPLLDPKNLDVADLLGLIRDISDRLATIEDTIDHIEAAVDLVHEDAVPGITSELHALIAAEPGHERAVLMAVDAVITDMEQRKSLIPVDEQDDGYEQHCAGCLLKKNGYPRLADLFSGTGGEHDRP
jgi:hypothetical protein